MRSAAAAATEVKSCCAAAYSSVAARYLLGDSFHPGGAELTARLVRALAVGPGSLVADIASGPGTSAELVARQSGAHVIGLDLSHGALSSAAALALEVGLDHRLRFACADAEALPLRDASVDGVLCECALCLFPDKERAVSEMARILRPGARLALSDVTAVRDQLPAELRTLQGWVACLADASPLPKIAARLSSAGLVVETIERHDGAIGVLLDRIEARLRVARLLGGGPLADHIDAAQALLESARAALVRGTIGYGVLIARR